MTGRDIKIRASGDKDRAGVLHGYMMPGNCKAFDARSREFTLARALSILQGLRDQSSGV